MRLNEVINPIIFIYQVIVISKKLKWTTTIYEIFRNLLLLGPISTHGIFPNNH